MYKAPLNITKWKELEENRIKKELASIPSVDLSSILQNPFQSVPEKPPQLAEMSPAINPVVKDYLLKKELSKRMPAAVTKQEEQPQTILPKIEVTPEEKDVLLENLKQNYSLDALKERHRKSEEEKRGLALAELAAGIGDALAGKPGMSAQYFDNRRSDIDSRNIGQFKDEREALLNQWNEKQLFNQAEEEKNRKAAESDPSSPESKLAQQLAQKMVPGMQKWGEMNAAQINKMLPGLQKIYEIESRKLDRIEAREDRKWQNAMKLDEKLQGLKTPYGIANTVDDAKLLKEAHESKKNFDNKLDEMIALREKHEGGALWNREDVGRGKQLSKDLLLEYKNMAKLGVLSKADEDIINAIIPADPLAFDFVPGQDPILHKLKKFKEDSDKDFATRIQTRTRGGMNNNPQEPQRQVVKKQYSPSSNKTKLIYSDGSEEVVDGKQ